MSSTRSEKANAEDNVTVIKVTAPAACIATDRPRIPRLSSSLQGLIQDDDGSDVLPSLYTELLSQLKGPYAIEP